MTKTTLVALLGFLLMICQNSLAQHKTKTDQQFFDLEMQWMNAWKDKDEATARKIVSDDFTLTGASTTGELVKKETWMQRAFHGYDCKSFAIDSMKVRVYGNTAVLNVWVSQVATINGKDWNGTFLLTDVWTKKKEEWQVVARHSTSLAKN